MINNTNTISNDSQDQEKPPLLRTWAICILPSLFLVFALWLPYGFSLIGHIEEWGLLGIFTTHGLFFITDSTSPMPEHALRPLTIFPQALAYYLDPYTFKYWNLLLALSIAIKGCTISYISHRLTRSWTWATVTAILFILYPADTMQLSFRALHINWALSFVLLATVIFLHALNTKNQLKSYSSTILSAAFLLCACAMYEASLLLSSLPLLVLFGQSGAISTIRQVRSSIWKHGIWFSGALFYITYVIHTLPLIKSYQGAIAGDNAFATLKQSIPHLFSIGLLRTTLGGWLDAARITKVEFSSYWYASAMLIGVIGITAALLFKWPQRKRPLLVTTGLILNVRLILIGLLLIVLGYAPFLLSPAHQGISQRTFLFASVGGALVCMAVLHAIHRLSHRVSTALTVLLVFIALSSQLYQFHHYVKLSQREQGILKSIVTQFDGKAGDKTLLLLDKTSQINDTWMFINQILKAALVYTYGHPLNALEVCHVPGYEWQQNDELLRKGWCEETANEWIFHYPEPVSGPGIDLKPAIEDKHLSKSNIITILVDPDSEEKTSPVQDSDYEKFLASDNGSLGRVYRGVIAPQNSQHALLSFKDEKATDSYYWNFGDWWSMEQPIAGSGWREAEWIVNSFHHDAVAWKAGRESTLLFPFNPVSKAYELRAKFEYLPPLIRASMKIRINDIEVPLTWTAENKVSARLLKEQLKTGMNIITFISDVDEQFYGLAAKMTSLRIK